MSKIKLSDPITLIRIMCGLIYIPHILFKLKGIEGAAAFFAKAGLEPAIPFVYAAILAESVSALGLISGFMTKWAGLFSAVVMAMATQAVISTKGAVWLWNFGGIEYNVVWCAISLIVAYAAWREERHTYGRNFLFCPPKQIN